MTAVKPAACFSIGFWDDICAGKRRGRITGLGFAVSAHSLEEDIQFVQQFQGYVVQLIAAVKKWESLDAAAWEEAREEGHPHEICYDEDDGRKIKECTNTYSRLRTTINFEQIRLRNIAARYQLGVNENWSFKIPAQRNVNPNTYTFTFDANTEGTIIREIELIRGALSNDLREERRRETRSIWRKSWEDYLWPVAIWFVKPEHSKFTLIAGLAIVVALVFRSLGYDSKTIVEIVKAIRGGKE